MTDTRLPEGTTLQMIDNQCGDEERESDANSINWNQIGEDAIRNFSEADKADQVREWADYRLAALFDMAVVQITNWYPRIPQYEQASSNLYIEYGLKDIREVQADLARKHFLETGEKVWLK
jgi:hypothetical protein